jgi:diguanylate cyclase (GGDEF)-like protein
MVTTPVPQEEPRRLEALRGLKLLDTPAEARFDRITRLAARLFDVPVAVMALVDADRVWVKSAHGAAVVEAPRGVSFAAHAILDDDILVVPDASRDPRFAGNPLVSAPPSVRFCAAAPLHAPDGSRIGALAVMDVRPRKLGAEDRQSLRDLAMLVEHELPVERMHPVQNDLVTERGPEEREGLLDRTTRAWNRAAIRDFLDRELARAKREQKPIGIAMVDVDGLTRLRKERGADAADTLLLEAARRIRAALRPYDAVGRHSDDGFLLILPGSDALNTMKAAERIRALVLVKPLAGLDGPTAATLSMGVASSESPGRADVESLVKAGSGALAQAKRAGGNRIELSGTRL